MLLISCHADTNFDSHSLSHPKRSVVHGHLDNFVGVHAVMQAYFSGRLSQDHVRIELTYGEERGLLGAKEVVQTLRKSDVAIVVDVTGTPTDRDLVIEKCRREPLQKFLKHALRGMSYDMYDDCPDPIANVDESDVYSQKCRFTAFLGVPVWGGDYNDGPVYCRKRSIAAVAEALCRIADGFPGFCEQTGSRLH